MRRGRAHPNLAAPSALMLWTAQPLLRSAARPWFMLATWWIYRWDGVRYKLQFDRQCLALHPGLMIFLQSFNLP